MKAERSAGRGASLTGLAAIALLLLVIGPSFALSRAGNLIDWRILAGGAAAVSLFTYFAYRSDKRRAEAGAWRIPESILHLCEFLGGWPGAFVAQRVFRHKIAKAFYQVIFWAIVALHQWLAFDFLSDWRFTSAAWSAIRS